MATEEGGLIEKVPDESQIAVAATAGDVFARFIQTRNSILLDIMEAKILDSE